jgi:hypothetical protein
MQVLSDVANHGVNLSLTAALDNRQIPRTRLLLLDCGEGIGPG